ncbi:MAG: pyruvate kinase [Candidatus Eisenbacteria bacterium]
MHRRRDGGPLRTRIVATLGGLAHEMYDPSGSRTAAFASSGSDWEEFLEWFRDGEDYLIDVLRMNMSFYEPAPDGAPDPECKELKILDWLMANRQTLEGVAVLGDLPGPKLRLMGVGSVASHRAGDRVTLKLAGDCSTPTICVYGRPVAEEDGGITERLVSYRDREERPLVSIGDGTATLRLIDVTDDAIVCEAVEDGRLAERKGVTFKGLSLDLSTFREDDEQAVDFLLEHGIDWDEHPWESGSAGGFLAFIAVSFVRSAEDVERARRYVENRVTERLRPRFGHLGEDALRLEARNFAPAIIAKIETKEATEDIERILDVADGAMVARGDLALQIGPHNVPGFQKRLIRLCNLRGKPVITATQMLISMVDEPEPTRAEASDVFNAILDGTDAVMLSDETASGKYPFQAVRTMIDIAEAAEEHLEGTGRFGPVEDAERRRVVERRTHDLVLDSEAEIPRMKARLKAALERASEEGDSWLADMYGEKLERCRAQKITDEISSAACAFSASGDDYRAIVAPTTSGRTVRMIARFRPNVVILGCAHDSLNQKKLLMSLGVCPINSGRMGDGPGGLLGDTESVFRTCSAILKSRGMLEPGALVVWTAGSSLFVPGTTNLIKIRRVE